MTVPSPATPTPRPGARVEFSAFNDGLTLLTQQTTAWITVAFVVVSIAVSVTAVIMIPLFLGGRGLDALNEEQMKPGTVWWWMQSLAYIPLGAWISAGGTRVALTQMRGGYVRPEELFIFDRGFRGVVIFTLIATAIALPFNYLNEWAGMAASIAVQAPLLFTVPLILDKGLAPIEAMLGSLRALRGQWFLALLFLVLTLAAASSGVLILCIGLLLTVPLAFLPTVVLYRRFFPDLPATGVSPDLTDSDFRTF